MSSSSEYDSDSSDSDAMLLPTDRESLHAAIERATNDVKRIEDGTADDFVLGCKVLLAQKQRLVTRAHGIFERSKLTALELYAHECEQATARHRERCEQLQSEMRLELEREIRRLENARDGVSVMDRRRLTRNMSNKNAENKTTARTSTARAADAIVDEKRRLETLLSKTPVFAPLDQQLAADDAANDVDAIARAVQHCCRSSQAPSLMTTATIGKNKAARRRLAYNPAMLQEGDRIVVYQSRQRDDDPSTSKKNTHDDGSGDDDDDVVASGVITAATAERVFLLCANGAIESIAVHDWTTGRLRVHAAHKRIKCLS